MELLTANYTFVNERLAAALRHSERVRQSIPARDVCRRQARPACSGRAAF